MSSPTSLEAKGFFAGLFDFHLKTFITLQFLRVIYVVMVVLILLTGLVFFLTLAFRGGFAILFALVAVPVITLFYLVLARIYVEVVALFFRIGENTSVMAQVLSGGGAAGSPAAGPGGGYGGAPATGGYGSGPGQPTSPAYDPSQPASPAYEPSQPAAPAYEPGQPAAPADPEPPTERIERPDLP
jgi:hypothetical protein